MFFRFIKTNTQFTLYVIYTKGVVFRVIHRLITPHRLDKPKNISRTLDFNMGEYDIIYIDTEVSFRVPTKWNRRRGADYPTPRRRDGLTMRSLMARERYNMVFLK